MKQLKLINIIISMLIITTLSLSGCKTFLPDKESPIVGNFAPIFLLKDGQGNKHSIRDYLGKVVLLEFWASY